MRNIPVVAVDQYDFLAHRREQEKKHWAKKNNLTELDSILTVEINTTELCNRTCVFCPRHDPKVFPNRNLHLTIKGAETIGLELGKAGFSGKISLSGFGENLLNPNFREIVHIFRHTVPLAGKGIYCRVNSIKINTKLFKAIANSDIKIDEFNRQ